ncbi:SWIM zinc finger family protein [Streptomyces sp. NPDC020875]|uniref:SWIM zinc finger family protein n=1 Tax=Streptomyces sp. NPDC020875 TaxID=3154898 RepID=UPI0033C6ACAE
MNAPGVRWTPEQVLSLAPDAASQKAGNKLATAGPWSGAGSDGEGAVWGLCKGSGKKPYQTVVDTTGPAYSCSCPSRKFPCKHALGLLLLWAGDEHAVSGGTAPDFAGEWLAGRRKRAEQQRERDANSAENAGSTEAGAAGSGRAADTDAARRRAERRAERITAGATELEQRLADLLRGGLASADHGGYGLWEETAARMVDAQAPGLAARVRELGAIPGSGPGWHVRLLEECALIHLLDTAWLGRDTLPEPLAATVRTRVGISSPAAGPAVRDRWRVLAQYDSSDGKVTTRRVWVHGAESGRTALLLSFGAAGRSPGLALPVGGELAGELVFHAGAGQLRAELRDDHRITGEPAAPPPGGPVTAALASYGRALAEDPWLESRPVTLTRVVPVPVPSGDGTADGWQLADATGDAAIPLAPAALSRPGLWKLIALSGGEPVTVFAEFGHSGALPLAAWSPAAGAEPIPLV